MATLAEAWESFFEAVAKDRGVLIDPKLQEAGRDAFYAGAGVAIAAYLERSPDFAKMAAEIMRYAQQRKREGG